MKTHFSEKVKTKDNETSKSGLTSTPDQQLVLELQAKLQASEELREILEYKLKIEKNKLEMAETKLEIAKNCANLEPCRKILNECCQVGFFSILILSILCAELLLSIDYVVNIYLYHVHSIISLIFILCRLFQVSKTYRQIEDGSVFSSLTIE